MQSYRANLARVLPADGAGRMMPLAIGVDNLPFDSEDGHRLLARIVDLKIDQKGVDAQIVVA